MEGGKRKREVLGETFDRPKLSLPYRERGREGKSRKRGGGGWSVDI